ncbi:MAG TPA: RNA pseudouridine synthase, partial [Gammaproteobacteria bacterium]|nr:RNA pseudouridine synthase [Gammaproteobacteria bacterium]
QTFIVSADGKNARTKYKFLKKLRKQEDYSLLELTPETGRTHQIRVHLAYISHPVVGDNIYGNQGSSMLLHANKLKLRLPDGGIKSFTAPLPESFKEIENE